MYSHIHIHVCVIIEITKKINTQQIENRKSVDYIKRINKMGFKF